MFHTLLKTIALFRHYTLPHHLPMKLDVSSTIKAKNTKLSFHNKQTNTNKQMWLLPQKHISASRMLFHSWRFSMFNHLILVFYSADSNENWGVFLSYNREFCSVVLPSDYYDS